MCCMAPERGPDIGEPNPKVKWPQANPGEKQGFFTPVPRVL